MKYEKFTLQGDAGFGLSFQYLSWNEHSKQFQIRKFLNIIVITKVLKFKTFKTLRLCYNYTLEQEH